VAAVGFEPDLLGRIDQTTIDQGIAGQSVAEDRIVVAENYPGHAVARPELVGMGIRSAMATPIHDRGTPIGTLDVGSSVPGRVFTPAEQETLVAFAQHATLALMDARTVDELVRQALHDPLTTLANRALFLDRLQHALARAERASSSVGVLFLDLDRFKGVNDSLGHAAGDALLIEVGRRLEALVRSTDTVARFGGDEFAVLLEDVDDRASVDLLAGSVVDLLRKPFNLGRDEVSITASIGVALARHGADDPLRDADLALYRAKSDGKNRHEFFVDEMRTAMRARLKLEAELQRAVSGDEFVLHYQPIVDLRFGSILGMEALIRWNQDGRGLLPPDDFIRLAEDTGAILAIGRWVLHEACRTAAAWSPPDASAGPFVSVNISPIQLTQIDLAWEVAETLAETGLDPARLVLEITETSLLDHTTALRKLRALKKLGVRLAVDDFGTGYSSLHYLQRFPVDMLKIAKPFIDELADSARGTLAQAIIDLGRTFKLDVIAEGIDRREHVTRLRKLGCSTGQGFLLSRPLDPLAASTLVREPRIPLPTSDLAAARPRRGPVPVVASGSSR
jgi:diguanylate cyclase (GGDEF)-like protein